LSWRKAAFNHFLRKNNNMAELPQFSNYNEATARSLIESNNRNMGGLPGFIGMELVEFGPGTLRAKVEVRDELLTAFGTMHGGVMAGFIDHVLGVVLYPLMQPGQWAATTEFKLNYLASVSKGTLVADSEVVSLTRTTAVVRALVTNEGRLCCAAQGTLLIREPRK